MGLASAMGCVDSSFSAVLVGTTGGRSGDVRGTVVVHFEFLSDMAESTENGPGGRSRLTVNSRNGDRLIDNLALTAC